MEKIGVYTKKLAHAALIAFFMAIFTFLAKLSCALFYFIYPSNAALGIETFCAVLIGFCYARIAAANKLSAIAIILAYMAICGSIGWNYFHLRGINSLIFTMLLFATIAVLAYDQMEME